MMIEPLGKHRAAIEKRENRGSLSPGFVLGHIRYFEREAHTYSVFNLFILIRKNWSDGNSMLNVKVFFIG